MTIDPETKPLDPEPPSPAWLARGAVGLVILIIIGSIALVGWRWLHVQFPNAALFIRGDAAADGAEIIVSNSDGLPIFHDRITAANQYQLVVLVEHGVYNVLARRDGKTLVRERLYVGNGGGVLLQVVPPDTRSTTAPAQPPVEASID